MYRKIVRIVSLIYSRQEGDGRKDLEDAARLYKYLLDVKKTKNNN